MCHILVVDDEAKIREVIREYAEFEGYAVTEAKDGMEAVELCRQHHYDLCIIDIIMPKLEGYSTCKEITKLNPIHNLM